MEAINLPILINQVSYSWSDIVFNFVGSAPIAGITEISYGATRTVTNNYGAGSEPVSRSWGNHTYKSSVTIYKEEYEAIKAIAPQGDITLIPMFTTVIAYIDDSLPIVVEKLLNCSFMNAEISTKQNDQVINYKLDICYAGLVNI